MKDPGWTGRPRRSRGPDQSKTGSNKGTCQIPHWRLNTGVAACAGIGLRFGLVVMESSNPQAENQEHNYSDPLTRRVYTIVHVALSCKCHVAFYQVTWAALCRLKEIL
jgi:hypothetical protein